MDTIERVPNSVWEKLKANPERAPETLALAAAERFAPQVEEWHRIAGHGRDPGKVAREVVRKHVRLARLEGFALGFGGITTSTFDFGALAWIQSRMVFYVAAASGYEPRHPMRPAELLFLWGIYASPAEARESLDGQGKMMAMAYADLKQEGSDGHLMDLLKRQAMRQARKKAIRTVPFVGAPVASFQNAGDTKDLGRRTLEYYGTAK